MRVFFSTAEASGELQATLVAAALRAREPNIELEGIGGERFASAGIARMWDTRGWAGMGPIEALAKIPKLLAIMLITALRLRRRPCDLIVLVDFGAFNLRLAKTLRRLGYRAPIAYYFPPGAWLDKPLQAKAVAAVADAITPFEHQRDFYTSCGLPIAYYGHPLRSAMTQRPARAPAPSAGGTMALLPGSRRSELQHHGPLLLETVKRLRETRPALEVILAASDEEAEMTLRAQLDESGIAATIVRGAPAALAHADVACIASGTAVLEAALTGVPTVALYVLSAAQWRIANRVYSGRFITLPNLLCDRAVVPERLQDAATPQQLASDVEGLLRDPSAQLAGYAEVRERLGPPDALDRIAGHLLERARA